QTITMVATAYGPSAADNYPYGATDYFGKPLVAGDVAVDPSVIPLGTRLYITGYSSPYLPAGGFYAVARDTGGAIQGKRVDIYDQPAGQSGLELRHPERHRDRSRADRSPFSSAQPSQNAQAPALSKRQPPLSRRLLRSDRRPRWSGAMSGPTAYGTQASGKASHASTGTDIALTPIGPSRLANGQNRDGPSVDFSDPADGQFHSVRKTSDERSPACFERVRLFSSRLSLLRESACPDQDRPQKPDEIERTAAEHRNAVLLRLGHSGVQRLRRALMPDASDSEGGLCGGQRPIGSRRGCRVEGS
ncbi:3D domain protein, partial [mine drainage metagenome]